MSRSGYSDDYEGWATIMWRGAVASAIRGKRGQAFLREMVEALDAMEDKRLVVALLDAPVGCCAMGAVVRSRGLDVSDVVAEDPKQVAEILGIARAMAAEIAYENDEAGWSWRGRETPEQRWVRMRAWAQGRLKGIGDD